MVLTYKSMDIDICATCTTFKHVHACTCASCTRGMFCMLCMYRPVTSTVRRGSPGCCVRCRMRCRTVDGWVGGRGAHLAFYPPLCKTARPRIAPPLRLREAARSLMTSSPSGTARGAGRAGARLFASRAIRQQRAGYRRCPCQLFQQGRGKENESGALGSGSGTAVGLRAGEAEVAKTSR